jgi:hypothetical protein
MRKRFIAGGLAIVLFLGLAIFSFTGMYPVIGKVILSSIWLDPERV